MEPLEKVLQRDPRRIPGLLEFVRYPYNSQIQQEAILLAQHLDERLPSMVQQLLSPGLAGALQTFRKNLLMLQLLVVNTLGRAFGQAHSI